MAQRGKQELFDALHQVESKFDVLEWRVKGIHLWPFIRHKISYEYLNIKQITIPRGVQLFRKVGLLIKGVAELTVLFFHPVFRISHEYLFLSKATYRTFIGGESVDRFCDSLLELAGEDIRKKSIILESGSDMQYRKPRFSPGTVTGIQGALYWIGIVAELKSKIFQSEFELRNFVAFKNELSRSLGVPITYPETTLRKQFNRVLVLADFFTWYLNRTSVRKVLLVCFHEEYGYALNIAAHRLGITSVDIQHGVEGKFHPVYSSYHHIPAEGFSLVPEKFWVWDKISFENIAAWNHDKHKPFLGNNVWLKYCLLNEIKTSVSLKRPMILVSLQPLEDPLPDNLLLAIRETLDRYEWFLRMHPRQYSQKNELMQKLERFGLMNKVEMEKGSQEPLPVMLKLASVHVTLWSSVVFEAFDMGVPSIVIHPTGKLMYSTAEYDRDFVHFAATAPELVGLLDSLCSQRKTAFVTDDDYTDRVREFVLS